MPHEVTLVPGDDIGITNHVLSIVEALGVDIRWDKPTESASHESLLASVRHLSLIHISEPTRPY